MTDTDGHLPPDSDGQRSSRQLIGLGIGAVVVVAAVAAFVMLGDNDGSDSVSIGSDPVLDVSVDSLNDSIDDEPIVTEAPPAGDDPVEATAVEPDPTVDVDTTADITSETAVESPPATDAQVATSPPPPPATEPPAAATATYQVTFDANWVAATHPSTLPGNAHFSDPVIAVHEAPGTMFVLGEPASVGIEEMAETGRTTTLLDELRSLAGVTSADSADGIDAPANSARTFDVTVSQTAPLVSFVTMLAPSPDWFVGFADRNLFVDGQWIKSVTFDIESYDAGTDSGADFTSDNAASNPADPIAAARDAAFLAAVDEGVFGTVTITKTG